MSNELLIEFSAFFQKPSALIQFPKSLRACLELLPFNGEKRSWVDWERKVSLRAFLNFDSQSGTLCTTFHKLSTLWSACSHPSSKRSMIMSVSSGVKFDSLLVGSPLTRPHVSCDCCSPSQELLSGKDARVAAGNSGNYSGRSAKARAQR